MIKKIYFFFLIIFSPLLQGVEEIEWISPTDAECAREIYLKAFMHVYGNLSTEALGISEDTVYDHLQNLFNKHLESVRLHRNIYCMALKKENNIIGYCAFKFMDEGRSLYMSIIVVDPTAHKQGLGKKMIVHILDHFPDVEKIILNTRKVNTPAQAFYKKLGFIDGDYIAPEYQDLAPTLVSLEYNVIRL